MRIRILSYLPAALLSIAGLAVGHTQTALQERRVSARCQNCEVAAIIQDLAVRYNFNISYYPNFFSNCPRKTVDFQDRPLKTVLDSLTACARVKVEWDEYQVIIRPLRQYTLSGRVMSAQSGEWLIGATVHVNNEQGERFSTTTNEYGFFSLKVYEGKYRISVRYAGGSSKERWLEVQKDVEMSFRLEDNITLPEVPIVRESSGSGLGVRLESGRRFSSLEFSRIPTLAGEADVMRYVNLQPGVLGGADGLGGLHVRGGNADQNLFLLDDVPVYNPAHALGLLSIFPAGSIHHAQLWKGDFPARYGGRASSVLDVRLRDGNPYHYGGEVSAGLFASSLLVEGPIPSIGSKRATAASAERKSSFLLSARRTHLEPWLHLLRNTNGGTLFLAGDDVKYRFYDLTFKANHALSERDQLHLSLYLGGDLFRNTITSTSVAGNSLVYDQYDLGANWGNNTLALRWNRAFAKGAFAKTILRYSRFHYQSRQDLLSEAFNAVTARRKVLANYAQGYQTWIEDLSLQTDWEFTPIAGLVVRAGGSYTFHNFKPGALTVNFLLPGQSPLLADSLRKALFNRERLGADELGLYSDLTWSMGRQGRLEAGIYAGSFEIRNRSFWLFQPRLRVCRYLSRRGQLWAGFHHTGQFLHQVGTFNLNFPFELWIPTTPRVLPEETWQASAGFRYDHADWTFSVEGYYRRMSRLVGFKASTTALFTAGAEDASGWEDRVITGTGRARGIELAVQRHFGQNFFFSLAYTYSQAQRQFPDLNAGEPFPFRFDRPHALNISASQRLTPWLELSALWVFASGNPITLSMIKFQHQTDTDEALTREVIAHDRVNNYRLPAYQRLDIYCRLRFKEGRHEFLIGVYNALNRPNPFFKYLDTSTPAEAGKVKAVQYTLLRILPELRYTFRFNPVRSS